MKQIILLIIKIYQKTLSPDTGLFSFKHPHGYCRFYPSCSEYSYQAIDKYGVFKGVWLSFKRIIRCNPFNSGGIDHIR
jgi:uncharacterized protein